MLPLVLVHGGGVDHRCWDLLVPHLTGPVLAVDLPGRGAHPQSLDSVSFAACAESVASDVDAAGFDEVVLVGHSLAGCSMPAIVERLGTRVRHAVFVACTVPEDGSSSLDTLDPALRTRLAGGGKGRGILELVLGGDLDDDLVAWFTSRLVAEGPRLPAEPVDLAPLRSGSFGRTWVRPLRDEIIPPDKQRRFAANVGDCDVVDIDAGHLCMVSAPEMLAGLLDGVADSTG